VAHAGVVSEEVRRAETAVAGIGAGLDSSTRLLGFPAEARVLILSCDDLGMHESINVAVLAAVQHGVASSASLMVPCPAAREAVRMLRGAPEVSFGIHLTLTRDGPAHRWAPISEASRVPSLVDQDGLFFTGAAVSPLLAGARIEDVERELRAQIDVVARSGLAPTHLDWHVMADGGRSDILDLTIALARENGLAARVWLQPARSSVRRRGLPVVDHGFVDSFALDIDGKTERYVQLLRELPAGLNEWAVHPAVGPQTLTETGLGWAVRCSDHDFLLSDRARQVIEEEGIIVVDYQRVQQVWRAAGTGPEV
jgi:chitin disaccharide deacetylase